MLFLGHSAKLCRVLSWLSAKKRKVGDGQITVTEDLTSAWSVALDIEEVCRVFSSMHPVNGMFVECFKFCTRQKLVHLAYKPFPVVIYTNAKSKHM